jgi:excinuclease ABC subunit C
MTPQIFQQILPTIPQQPGIYKYFAESNELIYVGKAKNLRKRVASYFNKTFTTYKTHELVQRIHRIEFTIVQSEQDAFLLENALIKQFQPHFNIRLKDDKTYPYIVIKKEPFPRVFLTRRKLNDGSEYIGPFTSINKVRELLEFIRQYIPLRTCKLNLTDNNIQKNKFKVCLEYHLGNCKGPCEGLQTKEDYAESLQQIRSIVKGNLAPVIQKIKQQMQQQAAVLEFEQAAISKKRLEDLENYQAHSVVVSKHVSNVDVFTILKDDHTAYINYLMVQHGTIVQTHTSIVNVPLEETEEQILPVAIAQLRLTFNSTANEIVVPFTIDYPQQNIIITIPKAGEKKKLIDLSLKNVQYFKQEVQRKKIVHLHNKTEEEKIQVLHLLQQDLQLSALPEHIECFDNSNFQGSYPVSAMVCFINGAPNKKEYRHFNVKTVKGINDFATIKEVVYRRYKRLIDEQKPIPQLIIIDGGKGQLSAAMESIKALNLTGKTTVVGLAKNEEEIFFPNDAQSIKLDWHSESFNLIRSIRDEVHRFGISFHRNQRSKGTFKNELEQIEGIGNATATQLLKTYKSIKNIKALSEQELANTIGSHKAKSIVAYFKEKK